AFAPHRALEAVWRLCGQANTYVDQAAPWVAAKKGDRARVETILATLLEVLRWLSIMVAPAMPERATEMRRQLGLPPLAPAVGEDQWPVEWAPRPGGEALAPGQPVFPRVDDDQRRALLERLGRPPGDAPAAAGHASAPGPSSAAAAGAANAANATGAPNANATGAANANANATGAANANANTTGAANANATGAAANTNATAGPAPAGPVDPPSPDVSYDEFAKVDLRVGLVVAATKVPKKDKLLDLRVDLGEPEPRRIVAGLALSFAPEALVGRRVVVVTNLAPRDFGKGLVSHGMILAAGPSEALSLPAVDERIAPGTRVKLGQGQGAAKGPFGRAQAAKGTPGGLRGRRRARAWAG
ncbi:MAG TPA: hypothetical protein VFS00_09590, partial [Polyangiaceae bacterium]|nr:hypothetical protein [Polyangiaceae bacterium]